MKNQKVIAIPVHVTHQEEEAIDLSKQLAKFDGWKVKQIVSSSIESKQTEGHLKNMFVLWVTVLLEQD